MDNQQSSYANKQCDLALTTAVTSVDNWRFICTVVDKNNRQTRLFLLAFSSVTIISEI